MRQLVAVGKRAHTQSLKSLRFAFVTTEDRAPSDELAPTEDLGRHRKPPGQGWLVTASGLLIGVTLGLIEHPSFKGWGVVGAAVALATSTTALIVMRAFATKNAVEVEIEDDDTRMRRRVTTLSIALQTSAKSLAEATSLIGELQGELVARAQALEELSHDIAAHEALAKVNKEASAALELMIDKKMQKQERRIVRIAWGQGAVYAVFGAAVAVAVVVFADLLPHFK